MVITDNQLLCSMLEALQEFVRAAMVQTTPIRAIVNGVMTVTQPSFVLFAPATPNHVEHTVRLLEGIER